MPAEAVVRCPDCGASFPCSPGPDCWCMRLPFQPMPETPRVCLCPRCLDRAIAGGRLAAKPD